MKKSCLLLLIAASGLVACTGTNESSNASSSEESISSEESLGSISLNHEAYTLNITNEVANPTVTLIVRANPSKFTDELEISWTSSNENVATVSNGVVTALAKGTTTISATTSGLSATCIITVEKNAFDNIINKNVTDFGTEDLNQALYRVSGVVESVNAISNNFRVVDTSGTGKYIMARNIGYAVSKEDDFTITDDKITYNSPDVFANLDIAEGKYVTLVGIYFYYANTYYFDGYLEEVTDGTEINYTASVSVNDSTYGSASLSKNENIKWGEKIEIMATPNEGYSIGTITCNDVNVSLDEDGKYVFEARAINIVVVSFMEAKSSVVTIDFATFSDSDIQSPSSTQFVTSINEGAGKPKYQTSSSLTNYLRLDYSSSGSGNGHSIDTIADFGGDISKVSFTAYSNKATVAVAVYGTNDAYADADTARTWTKIGDSLSIVGNTEANKAEYTVDVSSSYKYIRIQNVNTSLAQFRMTSVSYYVG